METLSIYRSSSASGHAPELGAARHFTVGFELDDLPLELALRTMVEDRGELEYAAEGAMVTITDRPAGDDGFAARTPIVRIGADHGAPGEVVIDSLDPALILAAATVAAAGYRIERERHASRRGDDEPVRLSQRERQVAELLVEGASNKVIARELGISVHTAKFHVTAVLEKLGARNRSDAVAISLREGLVTL